MLIISRHPPKTFYLSSNYPTTVILTPVHNILFLSHTDLYLFQNVLIYIPILKTFYLLPTCITNNVLLSFYMFRHLCTCHRVLLKSFVVIIWQLLHYNYYKLLSYNFWTLLPPILQALFLSTNFSKKYLSPICPNILVLPLTYLSVSNLRNCIYHSPVQKVFYPRHDSIYLTNT